jgi:hypothetical protein
LFNQLEDGEFSQAWSGEYTNPDGVTRPACAVCGFRERAPCMICAKRQPKGVLLPVVQKRKMVEFMNAKMVEISHAMGAKKLTHSPAISITT